MHMDILDNEPRQLALWCVQAYLSDAKERRARYAVNSPQGVVAEEDIAVAEKVVDWLTEGGYDLDWNLRPLDDQQVRALYYAVDTEFKRRKGIQMV